MGTVGTSAAMNEDHACCGRNPVPAVWQLCRFTCPFFLSTLPPPKKKETLESVCFPTAEEMPRFHTPLALAVQAGREGWAAHPSQSHLGEIPLEEPKEPRPVVS